ncbi:serine endopeptidase [Diaporthe helianthi]|uniref:Serine endopeptidase n=1 Tax=Diaporthe helianthi TaxID=158607 RepID=A0A2P5HH92_DIAHE|nr:serine endopeptidase [Diaporthe helianthi]
MQSLSSITSNLSGSPPECLLGATLTIGTIFDESPLFSGFSIIIDSLTQSSQHAAQKQCLLSLNGVAQIWSSQTYTLASSTEPLFEHPGSHGSRATVHGSFNSSAFHQLTGVNELHEQGVTGSGVVVAILDTGVDYFHPALGGGFGPEHRVRYGYDFVGDGYLNGGQPVENPDPFTECHYHGTHVSGIIAGNHSEVGFKGVAPDATLEMYRCTGCTNQPLNSEVVMKAALMAHSRGVDVISASLILEEGAYADDPLTEVLSRIAQQGRTVVVFAAGNWGWSGTFSVAAPAAASGILVVGAVNAQKIHSYAARARYEILGDCSSSSTSSSSPSSPCVEQSGQVEEFAWSPAPPSRFPESLPLRAVTLNASVEDDACSPSSLPSPRHSLQGVVVLVRRGGCVFADKMQTIKAAGAEYALIYDDTPEKDEDGPWSLVNADNVFHMRGVGFVSATTGKRLVDLLRSGREVLMKMDSNFTLAPYISAAVPNTSPPGQIAPRGTWGPDGEMNLIPSILAPGIGIMSSFPRSWGGYNVLSGTSMSTPYVAGCVALIRHVHPNMKAADIVRRLMSTARPLNFHDGVEGREYDFLAPPYKQGAGLVDCLAAATTTTEVSSSNLALGDAEFFKAEQQVQLINTGETEAVYQVSHVPASSVDSLSENRGRIVPMTLAYTDNVASDEFLETLRPEQHVGLRIEPPSPQFIRLPPGTEAAMHLTFDISGFTSERCPLYGGFVDMKQVEDTAMEGRRDNDRPTTLAHLTVPYAGVACRLRDVPVLRPQSINPVNYTFLTPATLQDPLGGPYAAEPIMPYHVFTIPSAEQHARCSQDAQCGEEGSLDKVHFPTISLSMAMQSRAVSIGLVPLEPPKTRRGKATTFDDVDVHGLGPTNWPAFAAAATTEHPGGFSRVWTKYFSFRGQLADGSWAPEGNYLFRICGVRAWDDPRDPSAFKDCIITDPFVLRYSGNSDGQQVQPDPSSTHYDDDDQVHLFDPENLDLYYYIVVLSLKVMSILFVLILLFAWCGRRSRQPWHRPTTGMGRSSSADDLTG